MTAKKKTVSKKSGGRKAATSSSKKGSKKSSGKKASAKKGQEEEASGRKGSTRTSGKKKSAPKKSSKKSAKEKPISVSRLRRVERKLLFWCALGVITGTFLLLGARPESAPPVKPADFLPLVCYLGSLLFMHGSFLLFRFRGDPVLTGLMAFLAGTGVLAQTRMNTFNLEQVLDPGNFMLPAGILLMVVTALLFRRGRYLALKPFAGLSALAAIGIMALVLAMGSRYRGAIFAPGGMTPSELLKILIVVFLAGFLTLEMKSIRDDSHPVIPPFRVLFPLAFYWAILTVLLVLQRDLGLFVILSIVLVLMLFLASGRWQYLVYAGLAAGAFAFLTYHFLAHGQRRLLAWQDPFSDPTGGGWQVLQALSGMYAGGLWGTGFGAGNPGLVPIAASDFIYAVIGEEMGFVGCVVVIVMYLLFFVRGYRISRAAEEPFGSLLAAGLVTVLAVQTFLNIAGVTKLVPITGITLPFISLGGSSLITNFASLGILLAVSQGKK
ncbi:MAG: cell division protein FtsW (lipid II flippase) [Kiritimatiellia bacterium]|jgi:cell division protein FtsW (lipid II flippase)